MSNANDPLARFRVSSLTPKDNYGRAPEGSQTYELTKYSAAPYIVTGRDKMGQPIEETVNIAYSQKWVHPTGTINSVVMRTSPNFSMNIDHVAYENEMTFSMLLTGWLPLWVCPYSMQYRSITNTRCLVENNDRIDDCGGHPDGCEHLKPIIAMRVAATRKLHDDEMENWNRMTNAEASLLLSRMTQAMESVQRTASASDEPAVPRPKKGA